MRELGIGFAIVCRFRAELAQDALFSLVSVWF